ncbi:MAG: efflux RND transporter permease subunit [Planctomycetia bacterium]|nr:efflux RND transporter permease subunit [Planctomycetia bacterium]
MQWLAEICVRRPVFALMLVLAMFVAGVTAYQGLGVDRFPKMDLPTLMVFTTYPGASSEEIETEITQILEDAVATVNGIDELRSLSRDGNSLLLITFNLNRDIDAAAQDVRDAVAGVLRRLPPNTDPPVVHKQDLDASPILSLVLSGNRDSRELYVLADHYVKNVIESAQGVGQVFISGAADRAVQVNIEARRLAAYQLSIMQVRDALVRQNIDIPGGRVDSGVRELNLRTLGRMEDPSRFRELVVASSKGAPVRLRDLGEVVDLSKEVRTLARLDGKPAVVIDVQRQSGTNTVDVIHAVKDRLPRCRELLPPGVELSVIRDQSRYIDAAMHEIQGHLIAGSVLATVVVLLFMRSWRSTLIAAVAIPGSLVATFAAMRLLGFTLNNVTMLALVLMVGIVIDDAIVVLENVFRFIEEKGMSPAQAAIEGTREIGLAVLATTLSLVIVFLPVSFLSSVTGRMLYEFGMTSVVAILISMLISFSLTPMMCSRLLRPVRQGAFEAPKSRRGFYHLLEVVYEACLRFALRHRVLVLLATLAVVASNIPLYKAVKQDYVPTNVDESEFEVGITAQEGTSIAAMDETMRAVEDELRQVRGVKRLLATAGSSTSAAVNNGQIYVELDDIGTRTFSFGRLWRATLAGQPSAAWSGNYSQRDVMQQVRSRLSRFKELTIGVRNQTSLRQGAPVDIDFIIEGPDINTLAQVSEQLRQKVAELPGIVDTYTTLRMDKPELCVDIDRERAAALGVDVREIAETLRIAVGGDDRVSRYHDPHADDTYDVELRLVALDRGSRDAISQLYVRSNPVAWATPSRGAASSGGGDGAGARPTATLTRLENVADFHYAETPPRIDRVDRQRMAAVRANLAPGFALADRIEAFREAASEMGLPPGFTTRVSGRGRELERTFKDFGWTFALSFIFMYLVLAAQFEHLVHPLTILVSLPLAVPFGLVSLLLGGETLNLYSALGILVLFGVVKKNSILQVDHTNQLRAAGYDRQAAILQANRDRLRPILMTTIAFVAGMLPLLIASGPGAEERRSIAVLAAGGQTLSLALTLLATPVVYSLFDDLSLFVSRKRARAAEEGPALEAHASAAWQTPLKRKAGSAANAAAASAIQVPTSSGDA